MTIEPTAQMTRRSLARALGWGAVAVLALAAMPQEAGAADYPAKPITIYVGYNPGDNMDVMTRVLAGKVDKILGQPITILNKPGGAGSVALGTLKSDPADGYRLAAVIDTPLDRMGLLRKMSYEMSDFAPILQFASGVTGIVVKADAPWKTFPEFIRYAKENPGKATYATSGAGSTMHVAMQYVGQEAGVQWTHVPYPGARDTLAAVLGGHINAAVGSTQWAEDVRAGTLRLLAVIGEKRMSAFPNVPTYKEEGYDFTTDSASVLVAPAKTPPDVIRKLANAFKQAMDDAEFRNVVKKLELDPTYRGPEDLAQHLKNVNTSYGKLIRDLGIPTEVGNKK